MTWKRKKTNLEKIDTFLETHCTTTTESEIKICADITSK